VTDDEGRGDVGSSTRSPLGRSDDRPSIGELVSTLSEKFSQLIRDEIKLAQAELTEKGKHAAVGVGLFAAAGFVAFFALATLITTIILALTNVVSPWLAALIVTLVLLLVAGILAGVGKTTLDKGTPPKPERAQASIKADVAAIKEGLHS
jgi:uncharacterized membrane protein YqjE